MKFILFNITKSLKEFHNHLSSGFPLWSTTFPDLNQLLMIFSSHFGLFVTIDLPETIQPFAVSSGTGDYWRNQTEDWLLRRSAETGRATRQRTCHRWSHEDRHGTTSFAPTCCRGQKVTNTNRCGSSNHSADTPQQTWGLWFVDSLIDFFTSGGCIFCTYTFLFNRSCSHSHGLPIGTRRLSNLSSRLVGIICPIQEDSQWSKIGWMTSWIM